MHETLELDLRSAFAERAAAVPDDAVVRLTGHEYHPRTSRLSPRLTVGSLAGIAATTGTVVSVVVLGGSQPAFAGWTAAPTAATSAQASDASTACQAHLAAQATLPGATGSADWTLVTSDVRGPYTVAIYQDGTGHATCFTGPTFTLVSTATTNADGTQQSASGSMSSEAGGGTGSSSVSTGITTVGDGNDGINALSSTHLDLQSADGGDYTLVEGQTASDVTGVTLMRTDGTDVQATTGDGWMIAWWPGDADAASAVITTASGQTSEPVHTVPLQPPGPGDCMSAASSPDASTSTAAGSATSADCSSSGTEGMPNP